MRSEPLKSLGELNSKDINGIEYFPFFARNLLIFLSIETIPIQFILIAADND